MNSNKSHPSHPSFGPHERAGGVYKITNTVNGRVYVGVARLFRTRWLAHKQALGAGNHHNPELQADWNTYGPDVFTFNAVEIFQRRTDPRVVWLTEQFWIELVREEGIKPYNQDAPKLAEEARRRNRALRAMQAADEYAAALDELNAAREASQG